MAADVTNLYDDPVRAQAYATLEFPGTYYLAFRDLPKIIAEHVRGKRALDFGCGSGRSTRFLRDLGFKVTGVDISPAMIENARLLDPQGDYQLLTDDDCEVWEALPKFDLILCAFPFDNMPANLKPVKLRQLARLLAPQGRIVNLVSALDLYLNEWLSFSSQDFPINATARCGDLVRLVMLDVADRRPVEDVCCSDLDYRQLYDGAALKVVSLYQPLGQIDEPYPWKTELSKSPWSIYVLQRE